MNRNLLNKFIANKCTSSEIDEVFDWFRKSRDKEQSKAVFKNYWEDTEVTDITDGEFEQRRLDQIHHAINLSQSERLRKGKIRFFTERNFSRVRIISRVAAVLLLPVLTLFIYIRFFQPEIFSMLSMSQEYEIVSPPGSRTQFELSDGTKVWLNHGSKMDYPQRFTGDSRIVKLTGEGYFEVAHNKAKPFIVEASGLAVKAVGTAFNVKAYPDDTNIETTLESGKVIILKNISGKKPEICDMKPGQHFIFNSVSNKYSLKTENPAKYVSWKEGRLIFQDDHLDQVAERLSRWYNVKVTLKDSELSSLTYTATFVDETLDQILEMLEFVTPISYTVSDRHKLPDGTFSEKEILICKKKKGMRN